MMMMMMMMICSDFHKRYKRYRLFQYICCSEK